MATVDLPHPGLSGQEGRADTGKDDDNANDDDDDAVWGCALRTWEATRCPRDSWACSRPTSGFCTGSGVTMETMAALGEVTRASWVPSLEGTDPPRGCETPGKWTPWAGQKARRKEALFEGNPCCSPKRESAGMPPPPSTQGVHRLPQFPPKHLLSLVMLLIPSLGQW